MTTKKKAVKKGCDGKPIGKQIKLEGRTVVVRQCPKCKSVILSWIPTEENNEYTRTEVRMTEEGAMATARLLCEVLIGGEK